MIPVAPRDAFGRREGPAWRQVREMSADLMIRGDQRVGHAASKSALNMSAVPPIAPELVCRNELTRCATTGITHCNMLRIRRFAFGFHCWGGSIRASSPEAAEPVRA